MAKPKVRTKAKEEVVETVDVETTEIPVEAVEVAEQIAVVQEEAVAVIEPTLIVKVTRDKEGRIVFESEGLTKRIAATDTVIPEVARQIGEDILKYKLI